MRDSSRPPRGKYAGIGSRATPADVLELMTSVAVELPRISGRRLEGGRLPHPIVAPAARASTLTRGGLFAFDIRLGSRWPPGIAASPATGSPVGLAHGRSAPLTSLRSVALASRPRRRRRAHLHRRHQQRSSPSIRSSQHRHPCSQLSYEQ